MEKSYLGIELGSTRIKSVLINKSGKVLASGSHTWENKLVNNLWTYDEDQIVAGVSESINNLFKDIGGVAEISAMGISGMMHGYIALDKNDNLLVPFRTWQNTNTAQAANALTKLFGVNIPMRWSIAHLYQAILNGEEHINKIARITTVAGYVHYKLTGEFVVGIGEASGMFPVDENGYNQKMLAQFNELTANKVPWKVEDILPKVLPAGKIAGSVTKDGADYFNIPIKPGTKMCPPEGDAGTGMTATNSVKPRTGNVSAGTSVFAMVVLDKPLKKLHTEIDVVATPDGKPVAMVHCNNCTSDINAWVDLLKQTMEHFGCKLDTATLTEGLFNLSQSADDDLGGLLNYNYFSGEPVTGLAEGRPLFVRSADGKLTPANFMKTQIYSSLASLAIGMDILYAEGIIIDEMCGHGGFFKTPKVGQSAMSAAIKSPVTVMNNAGEGGAWGIALLAAFTDTDCSLAEFLNGIFAGCQKVTLTADDREKAMFNNFLEKYKKGLAIEITATESI